jgi:hypothetical protein
MDDPFFSRKTMGGFMEHDKQKRMDHPSAEPYMA